DKGLKRIVRMTIRLCALKIVHNVSILNNKVHESGESGIQFNYSDFVKIVGNETYNNASSGWLSGISIYENRNITGDTSTTGYRNI
ncbi:hypothetical protein ACC735_38995, partial [Rhizobium ruizarguesonis]